MKKRKENNNNQSSSRILDDLSRIKMIDKKHMLSFCLQAPSQYREVQDSLGDFSIDYPQPQSIIVGGMGGSAIGGEILRDWCRDRIDVPIEVCREYSLPKYANKDTLVLILSYSGETEEALSMLLNARKSNCMIVCITSNGVLLEYAEKKDLPLIKIPSRIPQPRAAFPFLFLPSLNILERIGLVSGIKKEIQEVIQTLNRLKAENEIDKPFHLNFAKKLASKINRKIPIIYGFGRYRGAAVRFKQDLNENSKIPSKCEFFPELNHNEIVSWETDKEFLKNITTILIRDENEPYRIRSRIEATKELVKNRNVATHEIWSSGKRDLAKTLSIVYIGDITSIYLAILRGINPAPIRTIDQFKKKMVKNGNRRKILNELQTLQ